MGDPLAFEANSTPTKCNVDLDLKQCGPRKEREDSIEPHAPATFGSFAFKVLKLSSTAQNAIGERCLVCYATGLFEHDLKTTKGDF